MTEKNADYWAGYRAEETRSAVKEARRKALDAHPNLADLAAEVARDLGRDAAHKQRILQRSPHVFASMDALALGQASSREVAERELKALGIAAGNGDPVQLLDAYHAGRVHAVAERNRGSLRTLSGRDWSGAGMDSANPSFVDKYLQE